jgi:hypothetical protein
VESQVTLPNELRQFVWVLLVFAPEEPIAWNARARRDDAVSVV